MLLMVKKKKKKRKKALLKYRSLMLKMKQISESNYFLNKELYILQKATSKPYRSPLRRWEKVNSLTIKIIFNGKKH